MTEFLVLIVLVLLVVVIQLWRRQGQAVDRLAEVEARLRSIEIARSHERVRREPATPAPVPAREVPREFGPPFDAESSVIATPPPVPPFYAAATPVVSKEAAMPPVIPKVPFVAAADLLEAAPPPPTPPPFTAPQPEENGINLERFLGVKLFGWIGGLVLFLAVAFFIKYSFEKNYITPELRVALGYLSGVGLLVLSQWLARGRSPVTAQSLCGAGVVILYASTFAAHAYYKFMGATPAFAVMSLVTAVAFTLAVRMNAPVVAVLGLLGGFLTPPLLSTGVDNPVGLFGYLALLDLGLIAIALRQRWNYLVLLGAAATICMQFAWVFQFFTTLKFNIAMTVFPGFAAIFVAGFAAAHRWQRSHPAVSAAAILMPLSALAFAAYLLAHPYTSIVQYAPLFFTYIFLADVALLFIAWLRDELRLAHVLAGATVFLLLSWWTTVFLTTWLLNVALAAYFVFAVLHAAFPVILQKVRPAPTPVWWANLYPPLALVMILVPAFKMAGDLSLAFWPVVLLIDVVAIALAVVTASLTAILAVFLLTAFVAACWILQLPPALPDLPGMLVVVGGFAVFFMLAAIVAGRKLFSHVSATGDGTASAGSKLPPAQLANAAALGAFMPFLLLTLMVLRLPLANPTPVFGVAAVLVLMLFEVVRRYRVDVLGGVALAAVLLLEYAWFAARFEPARYGIALAWFTGFGLMFLAFPFAFQRHMEDRVLPWVFAALALPLHFHLIYQAFIRGVPDFDWPGVVPAVLAVPCLFGLVRLVGSLPEENRQRLALLALFGGATLFFITLIFPIQYEKQWLTISWALEGAALLWLFHRVPHPGLRLVGVALLTVAFVRLALNPEVLTYAVRGERAILNWYLYTYGLGALSLMLGAWLVHPPRNKLSEIDLPPWLYGMGAVLLFLLLNIEIADYFTPVGQRLEFQFSGNFGRDMAYSLGWALFAFALFGVGFKVESRGARYAGMGLLVVTLLKLFLHDLWQLGGLYRIGSLIGLAVVLILVSFIYQRFLSSGQPKAAPAPPSPPPETEPRAPYP